MKIKYYGYVTKDKTGEYVVYMPDVNLETTGRTLLNAIDNAQYRLTNYVKDFLENNMVLDLPESSEFDYLSVTFVNNGDSLILVETEEIE